MIKFDKLSNRVIGCAIEVHKQLGPGLLENTYKQCLAYELNKEKINFQLEVNLPVKYKDINISCGYRIDLLIEDKIIIELKCVDELHPIHEAQILNYLKATGYKLGYLVNFTHPKAEIRRFVL